MNKAGKIITINEFAVAPIKPKITSILGTEIETTKAIAQMKKVHVSLRHVFGFAFGKKIWSNAALQQ